MIATFRRLFARLGIWSNRAATAADRGEWIDQPPFAAWCNQAGIYDRTGTDWRRLNVKDIR